VENGFRGRTASSAYFENMPVVDKWVRPDGDPFFCTASR